MMNLRATYHLLIGTLAFLVFGCVKEVNFETESFESALVVEATITNENKTQHINLSRTFKFNEESPTPEVNATVTVFGGSDVFTFVETVPGRYESVSTFAAQPNIQYQLEITTESGRSYQSTNEQLTQETPIENIYAERITNNQQENGMAIFVDSFDPTASSKYYRYEYEETYKIVAPAWVPQDLIVIDEFTCEVALVYRTQEEEICYNTIASNSINLTSTSGLTEDRVSRHLIRFLNSENYIISHRYSILVRQFVQSREAYAYFEALNNFSEEGSLFSQVQPGFVNGNIISETNAQEKVIGFFEISSVDAKRLYFNYQDFYPNSQLPDFPVNCEPFSSAQFTISGYCGPLITQLVTDYIVYHSGASVTPAGYTVGPFFMVGRQCGDCTALGDNVVPDFWED